jgi:hypothetical protein
MRKMVVSDEMSEELDGFAVSALRRVIAEVKQRRSAIGFHGALECTLRRWSRLHLQSLAPTNPHWARLVGYGLFSLCVIHREACAPAVGTLIG